MIECILYNTRTSYIYASIIPKVLGLGKRKSSKPKNKSKLEKGNPKLRD